MGSKPGSSNAQAAHFVFNMKSNCNMEVRYLPCCFCLFRPGASWENIFPFPKVGKEINKSLPGVRRENKTKPKNATNKPAKQNPTKLINSSQNKQTKTPRQNKTHKCSER